MDDTPQQTTKKRKTRRFEQDRISLDLDSCTIIRAVKGILVAKEGHPVTHRKLLLTAIKKAYPTEYDMAIKLLPNQDSRDDLIDGLI